ncbi:2-methylaconitate cis-trans-isomerase PrpF/tripartite-type tricarboxylate transporter receptor subunit TctC [Arthrobacter sp. JUb119]|nr:2-methylaconitate cis-trans-isomerase PrpF/tripartite-type tricarboxylate transporter receptor subunit TctC [Arthrobacter sp. JUb119]
MKHTVKATWMRGGTSKCWVFERSALEVPGFTVDEVLLRLFGSPDPRQIDGVGGGTSTTSKAVILSPSEQPGVDIDYTFAQVGIDQAVVDWGSNCGNCSAVVAPYALKHGWIDAEDGLATVHIRNTNTGQLLIERMVLDGTQSTAFIPGVPFPGQAVEIGFLDPAGGTTGALFPAGDRLSTLQVAGIGTHPGFEADATLIDAGAPMVIITAAQAGLDAADFSDWPALALADSDRLDRIRRAGAVEMGLASSAESAQRAIPKLAIVQAPAAGGDDDFSVMMLSMGAPHPALAITGSVGLTMAARQPGTAIANLLPTPPGDVLHMQTPAGQIQTWQRQIEGRTAVGTTRTARELAEAQLSFDPVALPGSPSTAVLAGEPLLDPDSAQLLDDPPAHKSRTVFASVAVFAALGLGATLVGGGLLNPPAATTDGDYAGETVEMVIPLAEGGGTDTWARFVGQELVHSIPGEPGFAPINEAGGEGITGSNRFASSAADDGTELLVSTATTVVPWVLDRHVVKYSFEDLEPVLVNGTGGVIYARTAAGVETPQDLVDRKKPLVFGGISATGLDLTTLVAFDLLEADISATFGFEGRGPVNLALQRGEVDIDYTTTSSYQSAVEPIAKEGSATVLMSFGQLDGHGKIVRDPNFPEAPTVVEVYRDLHGKEPSGPKFEAYKTLLGLTYTYQKGLWAPKDAPDEAVNLLRDSAHELSDDKEFNDRAAEVLGGYPIVADENLSQRVKDAYTVTDETKGYVTALLKDSYGIELD